MTTHDLDAKWATSVRNWALGPARSKASAVQAVRRRDPITDDLLNHPDVVGTIRAVLIRRGIKDQELIDGIAEVQARACAATANDRPDTVARWQAVCRPIADAYGLDELRKKYARAAPASLLRLGGLEGAAALPPT